jgi:hypothetical protein
VVSGKTAAVTVRGGVHEHHFAQNVEVWLVSGECEHDQVRVESVQHMACVGVVTGLMALSTYELHDFVFSFAGHTGVAEDHCKPTPSRITGQTALNVTAQSLGHMVHERSAGRDYVGVESPCRALALCLRFLRSE